MKISVINCIVVYFHCFAVVTCISCSKKGKNNARIYDKRHSCFYCDKLCAKIARHHEHHHKDEAEVAEAFAYPRGSKDRKTPLKSCDCKAISIITCVYWNVKVDSSLS